MWQAGKCTRFKGFSIGKSAMFMSSIIPLPAMFDDTKEGKDQQKPSCLVFFQRLGLELLIAILKLTAITSRMVFVGENM